MHAGQSVSEGPGPLPTNDSAMVSAAAHSEGPCGSPALSEMPPVTAAPKEVLHRCSHPVRVGVARAVSSVSEEALPEDHNPPGGVRVPLIEVTSVLEQSAWGGRPQVHDRLDFLEGESLHLFPLP